MIWEKETGRKKRGNNSERSPRSKLRNNKCQKGVNQSSIREITMRGLKGKKGFG